MKTKLYLLALFALTLLAGCYQNESQTIKIGCLSPLTGEGATYGRSTREGVEFALAEINKSGLLPHHLEVIFEDDRIDPKVGVNAMRKLVEVDKVPVVIGPFGSSVVLACAPIANQNQCVMITASATADAIADAGDFVFRITPPNSKQGSGNADFCVKILKKKTAAILFQNNDYGVSLRDAFQKRFTELGGTVVAVEGIEGGTSDFRAQIAKMQVSKPDVVFFPVHHKEGAALLKQSRESGLTASFISADGAMTPELLTIAGVAAEGVYFSTLALAYGSAGNKIRDFEEAFKKSHNGISPDVYTAYYYEATKIVALALREAGSNGPKIRDSLYSMTETNAFQGITGATSFDAKGEVDKTFYVFVVKNGKYTPAPY